MATTTKTTETPVYCVNHPNTETLLRCYRCGNPVCVKCVKRTPVGLLCKQCMNTQQAGYYTATPLDYVLTFVVGGVLSLIGGFIAGLIGGFGFFSILIAIFYAPAAGGIIAEVIRFVIQRRRGRYIGLLAAALTVIGAIAAVEGPSLLIALATGQFAFLGRALFNFGLLIYLALATSTVYARLR